MTRIFNDGAEFDDYLGWSATSTNTLSATYKRTGNYAYAMGNGSGWYMYKNVSDLTEIYIRFGFYVADPIATALDFLRARHGTTNLFGMGTTNLGKLAAYVNAVNVLTGTNSISTDEWHLIEVYLKLADANGRIVIYLDGVLEVDYTGDTKPGADAHFDNIYFLGGVGVVYYLDDISFNDTAGGADNSYCGDGHLELLTPNANGDVNDWTGSDGDKVNNYLLVDDIPHDSDTTYVKSSTATQQDLYNLTDFTGTGKVITRVWPECRAKDNDVTGGQIKVGMKAGATTHLSSALTLSGNYAQILGDQETLNPDDSAAWEDADLDALQFVVECE